MADRQRVYEGRPGLAEWGEDLGEFDPRVLRAVRAGFKANVMPSPSGVPFAGLVESTKSLPALPMFLGDLFTGGKYGLSESAPEFALEASEKYDELIQRYLAEEGLREAERLGVPEKFGLAAGEMLGQLPVPGKLLERVTEKLPKAFKPAGWLAEYFGPTVDPKAINYAIGTGVGGTLRTATGEEEPEKFAKGGLGKRPELKYQGQHGPASRNHGAPAHDLTAIYPDDVYGPKAAHYYGSGGDPEWRAVDRQTITMLQGLKGKPDAEITIYRAVPNDPSITDINIGDWVTINPKYAKIHGESSLNGEYKIISKKVPAKDIVTSGDSFHEWGYNPEAQGFARGGLGRKSIVRKTEEGVTEAAPPKLEGMTIVKPVGNLNLAPAIRVESIKGPEKQTPQSLLNQAQKIPGVTKEGFEEATGTFRQLMEKYEGEPVTISKTDFESLIPPSEYSKVDLAGDDQSAWEHYVDMAMEVVDDNYFSEVTERTMFSIGLDPTDEAQVNAYETFLNYGPGADDWADTLFSRAGIEDADHLRFRENRERERAIELTARDYMENDQGNEIGGQSRYAYGEFQRLKANYAPDEPGYFEIGVAHPALTGQQYRHYSGRSEPLIGHIRGTYFDPASDGESRSVLHDWTRSRTPGGEMLATFEVKPNSVVIEELQSDVQKGDFEEKGALRQVHGTLFKAAVQEALERGADTVYLPTSVPIAAARGKLPKDYAPIYDQRVVKEGLNPLKKIPGVTVKPIEHEGQVTYYEIDFTPEAKEYILSGPGQLAPGYADGGRVDGEDYDEDRIEAIVAPLREKLESFLGEAQKVPRKAKQAVADITEIGDIIKRSTKIPLDYYDPKSEVAGEADAMRHLLFQAQLARKYGETPAKIVSYLNEYTSLGQPAAEREMDFYNDALGRELGLSATSDDEIIELARKYVDTGRVRVLPEEQRGGY